jgi:outer membrane protein TolC
MQRSTVAYLCCMTLIRWLAVPAHAAAPQANADPTPQVLSLDVAVDWALRNNPEMAALRQQHGIAAAGVVIARTYPFNPAWEGKAFGVTGPESAGITNRVPNEHKIIFDVECRGQGTYRGQAALAALSRTDWEIAFQESSLAVRVVRAFGAGLYRREKLRLVEEVIRLNEHVEQQLGVLAKQGIVKSADTVLAHAETNDARAQLSAARAALFAAGYELRRALGVVDGSFDLGGSLESACGSMDSTLLAEAALEKRADLHARRAAIAEAEARVRFEIANRYGNPAVGPAYVDDATRISSIGAHFTLPLPVLNNHQGEIQQRKAELTRAVLELRQSEVSVTQDVQAALARMEAARAGVETYGTKVLPELRNGLKSLERLYAQGDPGVDVFRLIDFRRRLLKAQDGYLDALFEMGQALADLALAVGDVRVALVCCFPQPSTCAALGTPRPLN